MNLELAFSVLLLLMKWSIGLCNDADFNGGASVTITLNVCAVASVDHRCHILLRAANTKKTWINNLVGNALQSPAKNCLRLCFGDIA